ncbi:hypothetical protein HJC23_004240 [Cyclotella cryptica]|uniref:Uncharacterized protein n=1 Tax=Cyclotella cryptica TaxID=29204 RepID=A0ABD3Q828_9STRA|eukprot:CCRYP_007900-RA/>CCRYP_007900-RA protein AED:0.00 eAED:0.00 QI:269/-1/1/1/-1/1/1/134/426
MSLSIDTVADLTETDENESPLGKRKSDTPSCRSSKRSPLSDVKTQNDFASTNESIPGRKNHFTPVKPFAPSAKTATPYSSSKFRPRVSKEEVEATDEGRASVDKLSAWLAAESARKAKKHPPAIVPAPNPVRFRVKPKINKEDVEATDDKRVSVKTLSAWISDDPFEQKKLRHIRSGAHVIVKSRAFEPDKPLPDSKKVDIKVGSVHEKQAWLSSAFKHEENNDRRTTLNKDKPPISRPYQNKPKPVERPEKLLKSVNEKKEWLSNAFKKNDHCILPSKSFEGAFNSNNILKSASADDADKVHSFPCISQRASYDGASPADEGSKSPVRLYKSSPVDLDSPKNGPITVHEKQQWLSNAFKSQPTHKASTVVLEAETKTGDPPVASTMKHVHTRAIDNNPDGTTQNDEETVVSVADRAKWLRGAFAK